MRGAAVETAGGVSGERKDLDALRRATRENAWHEREGSQRKVILGRQLFDIKAERCYEHWDYENLNAYTSTELEFKKQQAENYIQVRELSLEMLQGSNIALSKLKEIAAQDARLREGLIQAARERKGVKIDDLRRGGEAGQQVLEHATPGDEAAQKEAQQRAYEETLRKAKAAEGPEDPVVVELRRGLAMSQALTKEFNKRLARREKEDEAGAF